MGTSILPDMCTLVPQACGPQVHISGRTLVHMLQILSTTLVICGQTSAWIQGAKVVHIQLYPAKSAKLSSYTMLSQQN